MNAELIFTEVGAIVGLVGAVVAIVNTVLENRDAERFRKEVGQRSDESSVRATRLLQLLNEHVTEHALWSRELKEEEEKSLAALVKNLNCQKRLVEWTELLAERSPKEWRAWAERVARQGAEP